MGVVWGGGGGCNVFLTFDAISNIYKKKNLGIQNHYFSFNVFFGFFLYPGNIVKCPFIYSYCLTFYCNKLQLYKGIKYSFFLHILDHHSAQTWEEEN